MSFYQHQLQAANTDGFTYTDFKVQTLTIVKKLLRLPKYGFEMVSTARPRWCFNCPYFSFVFHFYLLFIKLFYTHMRLVRNVLLQNNRHIFFHYNDELNSMTIIIAATALSNIIIIIIKHSTKLIRCTRIYIRDNLSLTDDPLYFTFFRKNCPFF